jgi:hypothetical protein
MFKSKLLRAATFAAALASGSCVCEPMYLIPRAYLVESRKDILDPMAIPLTYTIWSPARDMNHESTAYAVVSRKTLMELGLNPDNQLKYTD